MTAMKIDDTLAIVEAAYANLIDARKNGNIGDATADGRKAEIAFKAANLAAQAHKNMVWLRDKLNEAIERMESGKTTQDAYLAMSWLNTSLWGDIQAARVELAVYADLTK